MNHEPVFLPARNLHWISHLFFLNDEKPAAATSMEITVIFLYGA